MDTDTRIRASIEKRMVAIGLSGADVARTLKVKHQSISPLLKGDRGKIPQSLINLLDALDLELVVQLKEGRP